MLNTLRLDEFLPSGRYAPVASLTKPTFEAWSEKKISSIIPLPSKDTKPYMDMLEPTDRSSVSEEKKQKVQHYYTYWRSFEIQYVYEENDSPCISPCKGNEREESQDQYFSITDQTTTEK